jgi:hypothetical protein
MNRRASIGFDRRIEIEWLDAAAAQAAAGAAPEEMRTYLWNLLDGVVGGNTSNSARGKTVTVLNHIWGNVPSRAASLRHRATLQLAECHADERLALHWAMMVGTYPIFTDVASAAGRLLTLQGSFTLAHLTRRLVSSWGERSTLARATQRIIRSMVQWGALQDTPTPGTYEGFKRRRAIGSDVGTLLIEALLVDAKKASIPFDQLIRHPTLFPFDVQVVTEHIRRSPQFRVHREGLDSDFVELQRGT